MLRAASPPGAAGRVFQQVLPPATPHQHGHLRRKIVGDRACFALGRGVDHAQREWADKKRPAGTDAGKHREVGAAVDGDPAGRLLVPYNVDIADREYRSWISEFARRSLLLHVTPTLPESTPVALVVSDQPALHRGLTRHWRGRQ
jgi:hypothetical protein